MAFGNCHSAECGDFFNIITVCFLFYSSFRRVRVLTLHPTNDTVSTRTPTLSSNYLRLLVEGFFLQVSGCKSKWTNPKEVVWSDKSYELVLFQRP
jgi:hypothetical protein